MPQHKLGTLFGVFIPNVTMMFGVILFLRVGLISGHAGSWVITGVICLSLLIMLITSASIASIATNMEVGSGGVYYLITRSLGIELGGALGLATYLSQLLSIALTISGFAYSVVDIFPDFNITGLEIVALLSLTLLSSASAKLALKMQGLIMIILFAATSIIFYGSTDNITVPEISVPFYENGKLVFWSAFALFYPAMTGIEAGMALSGNLRNPGRSLLIGNISSLIFVAIVYWCISIVANELIPHEYLISEPFSLVYYSHYSWLILVGICVATLSSALGSLLGAPRMLQSMADDGVVFSIFAKTYGKLQEPRWALAFTAVAALIITTATTIDHIIPMLTMICLINYGLLNLISALATWMNSPSWRPQFRVHYAISLVGVFLTIIAMFMVNPGWSFISLLIVILLYFILRQSDLEVSFQDFRNSVIFFLSRLALYRLANSAESALTWHPKLLVLTTAPSAHPKTVWLTNSLTRQSGILTFASIVPDGWTTPEKLDMTRHALEAYFKRQNIACLIEVSSAPSTQEGYLGLIKSYGIGPIQPNTVVIPIDQAMPLELSTIELIDACRLQRKNVLLIKGNQLVNEKIFRKRAPASQKNIELYWDSDNRSSFDLLLSLIMILHDSPKWNKAAISLKAHYTAEQAAENLQEFLESFVEKSRLKMQVSINHDNENLKTYSVPDIIAAPFRPLEENEELEDYLKYLNDHLLQFDGHGVGFFVCCYDDTEHREIFTYPEQ